jgi:hypothetical protein
MRARSARGDAIASCLLRAIKSFVGGMHQFFATIDLFTETGDTDADRQVNFLLPAPFAIQHERMGLHVFAQSLGERFGSRSRAFGTITRNFSPP